MYDLVKLLIDDVLMAPALAPFTTLLLVIFIAIAVLNAVSGGDADDLPTMNGDMDE